MVKKAFIILAMCASLMLMSIDGTVWAYEMDPGTDPVFGLRPTSNYGMIILMFWDYTTDCVLFDLMLTDLWKAHWKEQISLGNGAFLDAEFATLFLQEYDTIVDAEDLTAFLEQNELLPQNLLTPQNQGVYMEALQALETSAVPEPSTCLLMITGVLALLGIARRNK